MHIAFFDVQDWEKSIIRKTLAGHDLHMTPDKVSLEHAQNWKDTEILSTFVYSSCSTDILVQMPKLKLIVTRSTGFDHIDLDYCKKHHITVANVPFYGENTVAEHTFALILSLSRNIHRSYVRTVNNNFSIDGLVGFDLKGKTLGVLGAGHIGQHVIRMAKGFGMNVIAFDTRQDPFLAEVLGYTYASAEDVLKEADIVSLHMPYNEHTKNFMNTDRFQLMKPNALFINTARGGLVDTEALLAALDSGKLKGAGLDVIEGEDILREEHLLHEQKMDEHMFAQVGRAHVLLGRENVVYTPHIAFYSEEALQRILQTTLENITTFVAKGIPVYPVNL